MKTKFTKKGRRILSAALCLLMMITALPMSAFAWTSEEGKSCTSSFGDYYVGSDGEYYRSKATYSFIVYDSTGSDNLVIYGHHIKGGKMFGALEDYKSQSFYEEHKTIQFDTLTQRGVYEIIAVFKTVAYSSQGFRYYDFVNAESKDEFNDYIQKCKELALYETGVTAEYGDRLITLSTCEYSAQNGRLVVVAKKTA